MTLTPLRSTTAAVAGAVTFIPAMGSHATTPAEALAGYAAQAGANARPDRGQQLFITQHSRDWSCASCHGALPTQGGEHASTGKPIGVPAPAFNPERFTDAAKTEKRMRRNCNDVMGRECSAVEKADVLDLLLALKP